MGGRRRQSPNSATLFGSSGFLAWSLNFGFFKGICKTLVELLNRAAATVQCTSWGATHLPASPVLVCSRCNAVHILGATCFSTNRTPATMWYHGVVSHVGLLSALPLLEQLQSQKLPRLGTCKLQVAK